MMGLRKCEEGQEMKVQVQEALQHMDEEDGDRGKRRRTTQKTISYRY